MQVAPLGDQILNQCKWRHLVAKFETGEQILKLKPLAKNLQLMRLALPISQICNQRKWCHLVPWWPHFLTEKVAPPGGKICNWCKWCHLVAKFVTKARGYLAYLKIVQITWDTESIVWVSFASGNVYIKLPCLYLFNIWTVYIQAIVLSIHMAVANCFGDDIDHGITVKRCYW